MNHGIKKTKLRAHATFRNEFIKYEPHLLNPIQKCQ